MSPQVVVVGGGLAGLSVAWHLAPTHRVLVLEQGPTPGSQASAQNAGMLRRMGEDPYERALAVRTHDFLSGPLPADWEHNPSRVTGAVMALHSDPEHLHDAAAHLAAKGLELHALRDPAAIAPALRGAPIVSAWHLPQERVVDPHGLLQGFLTGLRRMGGTLRCNARVTGLTAGAVTLSTGEVIEAPITVLAGGAWSWDLARRAGLRRSLVPVRRALMYAAPHPLVTRDHPWTWIDDIGLYIRPEGEGVLVSACDEALDYPDPQALETQGPLPERTTDLLAEKLQRYMPALADLQPRRGWTGLRTFAPDRRPVLGADPERPDLWWAAGLGGFGVTCSVGVGQALAAWIRGEDTDWLHRPGTNPARPHPSRWLIRPQGELRTAKLAASDPS